MVPQLFMGYMDVVRGEVKRTPKNGPTCEHPLYVCMCWRDGAVPEKRHLRYACLELMVFDYQVIDRFKNTLKCELR